MPPTCFNCKRSVIDKGYPATREQPGMEPWADCSIAETDLRIGDTDYGEYNRDATPCPMYDPVPVGKCHRCKLEISSPAFLWGCWVSFWEDVPACSEKCERELKEESDRWAKEMSGLG